MTNELTNITPNEMQERDGQKDYTQFYERLEPLYVDKKDPDNEQKQWTKERIIEMVENDAWSLREGRGGGVCVQTSRGYILPGSPPPMPNKLAIDPYAEEAAEVRQALMGINREMNYEVEFFGALMSKIQRGDVQAMRLYAELFVQPKPMKGPTLSARTVNVSYHDTPEEQRPIKEV
jgi:hypothetical protein